MFENRSILHPTDFSECSEAAFHLACSLARDHRARLIVLHVIPPPESHSEVVARQQPNGYREQMCDRLYRLQAPGSGVDIDHRLTDGEPFAEILRVAEQVVRRASCPVLTVKTPFPEPVSAPEAQAYEVVKS